MTLLYRCDTCGKIRDYLSDSWSEITVLFQDGSEAALLHCCLECRSDKREVAGGKARTT